MNTSTITPSFDPEGIESGSAHWKYHELHPFVRRLLAASVSRVTAAVFLRLPNFFPVVWPLGPVLLYLLILAAGLWAAVFLGVLTSLSGNALMAVAVPGVIVIVEFIAVPILKFQSLLGKSVSSMRAFIAGDRQAKDAFHHEAHAMGFREWIVLIILIGCFLGKAYILLMFGTFQPTALLAANWIVAIVDFGAHLSGVTSKVPYFSLARTINWFHRRIRLSRGAKAAVGGGKNKLGALADRKFEFESPVALRDDEVDGHILRRRHDGKYDLLAPGTLDDSDRASFLNRQGNELSEATLARALAAVQLKQLDAAEQRSGRATAAISAAETTPPGIETPRITTASPSATA